MAINYLKPPVTIEWQNNQGFRQDMPDDEWLAHCGERGWIAFSHDRKFHSEAVETAAVKQHGVGCFYLPCAQEPVWEKARCLVRSFERIKALAETTPKPFIYNVRQSGQIVRVGIDDR